MPACPAIVLQPYFTAARDVYAAEGVQSSAVRHMQPEIEHAYSRGLFKAEDIDVALGRMLLQGGVVQPLAVDGLCPAQPCKPAASLPDGVAQRLEPHVLQARHQWDARVNKSRQMLAEESDVQKFFNGVVHPIGSILASDLGLHVTGQKKVEFPPGYLDTKADWSQGRSVQPDTLVLTDEENDEGTTAGRVKSAGELKSLLNIHLPDLSKSKGDLPLKDVRTISVERLAAVLGLFAPNQKRMRAVRQALAQMCAGGVRIGFLSWLTKMVIILLEVDTEAPPGFPPLQSTIRDGKQAAFITFCVVDQHSAEPTIWRRVRQLLRCAAAAPECASAARCP